MSSRDDRPRRRERSWERDDRDEDRSRDRGRRVSGYRSGGGGRRRDSRSRSRSPRHGDRDARNGKHHHVFYLAEELLRLHKDRRGYERDRGNDRRGRDRRDDRRREDRRPYEGDERRDSGRRASGRDRDRDRERKGGRPESDMLNGDQHQDKSLRTGGPRIASCRGTSLIGILRPYIQLHYAANPIKSQGQR